MKNKKNKEYTPHEAMPKVPGPVSMEALSRLQAEKKEQIEYYYFDPMAGNLLKIPSTVDRIDLSPRRQGECLVKIKNGIVAEIRPFGDEMALEPEIKKNLEERIEKILGRQSVEK